MPVEILGFENQATRAGQMLRLIEKHHSRAHVLQVVDGVAKGVIHEQQAFDLSSQRIEGVVQRIVALGMDFDHQLNPAPVLPWRLVKNLPGIVHRVNNDRGEFALPSVGNQRLHSAGINAGTCVGSAQQHRNSLLADQLSRVSHGYRRVP
ncbi:hypothetical protein D3C87_1707590 [compost metagenome]